nr:hypothetical protein [Tanacetum cinerariifolium]
MDPNSSLEKIGLGNNVIEILSDKVKGSGDWNSLEYQDTTSIKGKKVTKALSFYKMETNEVSERYIAPCFMYGLEAYDGEINLAFDENLISKEYVVKLCLDYEVKKGNKVLKKELIAALKGELYFFKFIINPEEDDVEPGVILGRSFMRLAKGIVDFELPPLICKMGKSDGNTKRSMKNLSLFYQDIRPYLLAGGHLTQEKAAKEALAKRISQKFALFKEVRPIIKTMAYHDKYKKNLDEIWKDKVELDGKIVKEEEEVVERIKGEALREKDDLGAFIFPMRLEGREEITKVDRRITMINHTQAKAVGILINVLCQVGVTTIIAKFIILDIPIDRDVLIVIGQGLLYTTESDSDDEEEYQIKKNKFGAPIYGPKPAPYLNYNDPADRSLALQAVTNPF